VKILGLAWPPMWRNLNLTDSFGSGGAGGPAGRIPSAFDSLGEDVMSRVNRTFGARVRLSVDPRYAALATVIGVFFGMLAGY